MEIWILSTDSNSTENTIELYETEADALERAVDIARGHMSLVNVRDDLLVGDCNRLILKKYQALNDDIPFEDVLDICVYSKVVNPSSK